MRISRRVLRSAVTVALLASPAAAAAQSFAPSALRILLVIDSSSAVAPMLNWIRTGLNAFMKAVPAGSEVVMVSTGGQLRVRMAPTTDRDRWLDQANRFAQDGGANALVDTLLEADRRFLSNLKDRRPEIVILTTD